jgi:hypothetical protein
MKTAYTRAGIKSTGEINHPKINEIEVAATVNGGARYL